MHKLILIVAVASFAACRTAAPVSNDASDRRMLGLDDEPLQADWLEWTPQTTASTPAQLAETATAFDFWQVTDPTHREESWAAIFGLLSEVRRVAPREYEATLRMLMTVLEPQTAGESPSLDATFFAAKRGGAAMFEGVGWRFWRRLDSGAAPGVTIWLRRYEASPEQPVEAFVWFYGGFAEAKSLTLRLDGTKGWAMTLAPGIATMATTAMDGESELLRSILLRTFWKPVVGAQYLETPLQKLEETVGTPQQQPVALGLPLGDRDIDQVFTDSVFAPRLTLFPAKQPTQ